MRLLLGPGGRREREPQTSAGRSGGLGRRTATPPPTIIRPRLRSESQEGLAATGEMTRHRSVASVGRRSTTTTLEREEAAAAHENGCAPLATNAGRGTVHKESFGSQRNCTATAVRWWSSQRNSALRSPRSQLLAARVPEPRRAPGDDDHLAVELEPVLSRGAGCGSRFVLPLLPLLELRSNVALAALGSRVAAAGWRRHHDGRKASVLAAAEAAPRCVLPPAAEERQRDRSSAPHSRRTGTRALSSCSRHKEAGTREGLRRHGSRRRASIVAFSPAAQRAIADRTVQDGGGGGHNLVVLPDDAPNRLGSRARDRQAESSLERPVTGLKMRACASALATSRHLLRWSAGVPSPIFAAPRVVSAAQWQGRPFRAATGAVCSAEAHKTSHHDGGASASKREESAAPAAAAARLRNPAAVLRRVNEIVFEEHPEPLPADPPHGHVRVAMKAVGICGSDLHYVHKGAIGPFVLKKPMVLGHEGAGEVVAVGDGAPRCLHSCSWSFASPTIAPPLTFTWPAVPAAACRHIGLPPPPQAATASSSPATASPSSPACPATCRRLATPLSSKAVTTWRGPSLPHPFDAKRAHADWNSPTNSPGASHAEASGKQSGG